MMNSDTPYLQALSACLPTQYSSVVHESIKSTAIRMAFETLLCFAVGGACPVDVSSRTRTEWASKQPEAMKALKDLAHQSNGKRGRESDEEGVSTKRQKTNDAIAQPAEDDLPLFSLPSISTTSPIRKKVDIAIHKSSIRFLNPSSRAVEATVQVSSIKRAFLLPTRGKSKAHWTVVLLTSDVSDKGKSSATSPQQIIFGLDAASTTKFDTTTYVSNSKPVITSIDKGSETEASLRQFLSFLPAHALPILEPSTKVFRSACGGSGPSGNGIPGVEAYRAAKSGTLWFLSEGILWGESKPCEFWALEDLSGKTEGVRLLSATGRTCTVILKRKDPEAEADEGAEESEGIETEFSMVDGKEQDPINQWAKQRRDLFGKKQEKGADEKEAAKLAAWDDSDPDDEDFELDSEDIDGGSASSGDTDGSEAGSDGQSAEASDAVNSDSDRSDEEQSAEGSDAEEELDPKNHPLLRPGAMPRMSRAAVDAAVNMVNEDMLNGESSEEEEDELEEMVWLKPAFGISTSFSSTKDNKSFISASRILSLPHSKDSADKQARHKLCLVDRIDIFVFLSMYRAKKRTFEFDDESNTIIRRKQP
ncbi:hypothetical protein SERLA73DRAFT_163959 [Serpula lacrymans var. lacrymans S7.3]|uniref:Histone chaperone RTT106/FACT complex subunit SPT16-like middle domain-containing protein n=1 Tax=Serpula lacrymans var. lacrymans (strain S7.3) TaxID=936435 RepID=F8QGE7_SERL3|nr:hypothetical protein SERLA73DRAFT_163959 [Serpula lacrymans var. lacrymans S7.3]